MTDQEFATATDHLIDRLRVALRRLGPPASGLVPAKLGKPGAPKPHGLPVLDNMAALVAHAPPGALEAVRALQAVAAELEWRQTYARPAVSEEFLLNYGWSELIGPTALYTAPDLSVGILLLGPNTRYPEHQHEALEHYVPLSGQAEWFTEDTGWRRVKPLQVIIHRPWIKHAMQTRTEPLLALYRWSGPGVGGHARLT